MKRVCGSTCRVVLLSICSPRSTPQLSGRPNCYETLVSSRGSEKAGVKMAALTESSSLSFQNIGKSKEKLRKRICPSHLVGKESACIRHMRFWPSGSLESLSVEYVYEHHGCPFLSCQKDQEAEPKPIPSTFILLSLLLQSSPETFSAL